jgi:hypothetical protein
MDACHNHPDATAGGSARPAPDHREPPVPAASAEANPDAKAAGPDPHRPVSSARWLTVVRAAPWPLAIRRLG